MTIPKKDPYVCFPIFDQSLIQIQSATYDIETINTSKILNSGPDWL